MASGTRVLVTYASEHGGTQGIAEAIGEALGESGVDTDVTEVGAVRDLTPYRAAVVGSAVYMFRWRPEAVRFLQRNADALSRKDVWIFDSGPVGEKIEEQKLPEKVARLAEAIGVRGRRNFGGRLDPEGSGFLYRSMAKKTPGDWRDFDAIRAWARDIAETLAGASAA
jgi:menaquinone-dependent protoporphyrinogen oxidase